MNALRDGIAISSVCKRMCAEMDFAISSVGGEAGVNIRDEIGGFCFGAFGGLWGR